MQALGCNSVMKHGLGQFLTNDGAEIGTVKATLMSSKSAQAGTS
jgi:hypothetical protein